MPTYLSNTTSRANSSLSDASVIAAPPYLITTVLPWNSRMYGSASSSVVTSRSGRSGCVATAWLGGVLGIQRHVFMAQVGEIQLGLGAFTGEVDLVFDLVALHRGLQGVLVVRRVLAPGAYRHPLDRHPDRERRGPGHRHPDGLDDPPPVRVTSVQRGLDEWRIRHRARDAVHDLVSSAAHDHAAAPSRTIFSASCRSTASIASPNRTSSSVSGSITTPDPPLA